MELNSLEDIIDYEVSTASMKKALTFHNQIGMKKALTLLNPEKITRRCIYVADAVNRFGLSKNDVETIFKTALEIDNKQP